MISDLKCLFAAALACSVMAPAAAECRQPAYPKQSYKMGEEGISVIAFLIHTDGTVARATVRNSSGSKDLDQVSTDALSACTFEPVIQDGKPVESWHAVMYVWSIDGEEDMARAKHAAAVAATKGDLGACYQLSMLLRATARSDADRKSADILLRSAADQGLAPAQFEVGSDLEKGLGGQPKNLEAAMAWYRKAAAQGDVLAVQRLEKGFLL